MIVAILGMIDIAAGALLAAAGIGFLSGNPVALSIALVLVIKGILSMLSNMASGTSLDPMGALDIVASICLFLSYGGILLFFFPYVAVILLIKGIYSFVTGVIR